MQNSIYIKDISVYLISKLQVNETKKFGSTFQYNAHVFWVINGTLKMSGFLL